MSMNEFITYILSVFTGFFAIMNPIANTPIFVGLTEGKEEITKRKIAKSASITAFVITAVFVLLGKYIFEVFSITIPAFKITGGILIFYVGFEMLMSKKSKVNSSNSEEEVNDIAISPLAIPILAGPGTIVTAMNFASNAGYLKIGIILMTFGVIIYLTYLCFKYGSVIINRLGNHLIGVIGKLMGLIIAIIGTGMVIGGIKISFGL